MVMETRYNPSLVTLSVLVAIFASYVALNLASSVTQAKGRAQIAWLACGALAMGVGIWSMHFIGMLAFEMPGMEMGYDVPLMILSVFVAIGASALALFVVSRPEVSVKKFFFGGIAMAGAIAGMHYIGMYSMRMAASIQWNMYLVSLSVVIALVASFAALFISHYLRNRLDHLLQLTLAATTMGFAISGMHYTGMVAATFIHKGGMGINGQNLLVSSGLAIAVITTTVLILGLALAGSVGQRLLAQQIKRANELARSEARKAAILNASLEAIITIDHTGKILEWNITAERTFGFSGAEAIGREVAELIIPQRFRNAHREGLVRYLTTGIASVIGNRLEMSALRASGEEFPIEISIGVILGGEESPPMFTASARDITDRVHAQETLKKNEERFRCVIEVIPYGLLMVSRSGKIALCNSHFEAQFGYKREEIVGREMELLVPERYRYDHLRQRESFFQAPVARPMGAGRDLWGLRKDGSEFPVEIALNSLVTDEGAYVLASVVDITKRKALEDRVQHSAKRLQQKNHEMEQFVYTVSHDLKSPLVTSSGFLGLLKEDIAAKRFDKVADSVVRLERANSRMNQLIDDLLQLSRAGRIKLEGEEIDVCSLVKTICENLCAQIREKSVTVTMRDDLPLVTGDRKRIYQVFENLIVNALKYGCDLPNPKIMIGAETTNEEIRFFIRDHGQGIAKEYHKKIFGLFQRLESDNRGTGVGLAIVSRIMQLHAGRVWVESEVGSGATFWLAFPKTFVVQGESDYE
jgi:PAS domain S-box-containing protein